MTTYKLLSLKGNKQEVKETLEIIASIAGCKLKDITPCKCKEPLTTHQGGQVCLKCDKVVV